MFSALVSRIAVMAWNKLRSRTILGGALVFSLSLLFFSAGLDNRPFYTRGEGREAIVARDMLRLNNLILPYEDVVDLPTKPPLLQWSSIVNFRLVKLLDSSEMLDEWNLRFPSAFYSALTLAVFFIFLRRRTKLSVSLLTILILGSTAEWIRSSGHARVDMGFSAFVTLGCLCIYSLLEWWRTTQGLFSGSVLRLGLLTVGIGVLGALAILGKGPAGLAFPVLTAASFVGVVTLVERPVLKLARVLLVGVLSVLLAVGLAGIWYFSAYSIGGEDFTHVHLFKENIGRFALIDGKDQGHVKPFYYSLIYLFLGFLPASLFLPQTAKWLFRQRVELLRPCNSFRLFCVLWALVVLGVVTLSSAKRDVYLLPGFAPLAYLIADGALRGEILGRSSRALSRISAVLSVAIFSGFALVIAVYLSGGLPDAIPTPEQLDAAQLVESLTEAFVRAPQWSIFLLLAAFIMYRGAISFTESGVPRGIIMVSLSMLAIAPFINYAVLPAIAAGESPREFMGKVRTIVPDDAMLYQLDRQFFSAMFYADRRVSLMKELDENQLSGGAHILVEEDLVDEVLRAVPRFQEIIRSETLAANGDEPLVLLGPAKELP